MVAAKNSPTLKQMRFQLETKLMFNLWEEKKATLSRTVVLSPEFEYSSIL
jgi:hypothetical protein